MIHIVYSNNLAAAGSLASHPDLPAFNLEPCRAHECDAHLVLTRANTIVARSSLWWTHTPEIPGKKPGLIGHFAALDAAGAKELLAAAGRELKQRGRDLAVGPMDGNTWRRYRLLSGRGSEPTFFLEPDNPDTWPGFFLAAGFAPLATYFSALAPDLAVEDERIPRTWERLEQNGIQLRPLDPHAFHEDLRRIYEVSRASFQSNFLYTPISEAGFLAQYEPMRAQIQPDLVILAEHAGRPVGFAFAIPDLAQAKRGLAVDTVVVKTVAVLPGRSYAGLGNVLLTLCHRKARALGFRRAIHALMHESNNSLNMSGHYARPFRRYTLYSRPL